MIVQIFSILEELVTPPLLIHLVFQSRDAVYHQGAHQHPGSGFLHIRRLPHIDRTCSLLWAFVRTILCVAPCIRILHRMYHTKTAMGIVTSTVSISQNRAQGSTNRGKQWNSDYNPQKKTSVTIGTIVGLYFLRHAMIRGVIVFRSAPEVGLPLHPPLRPAITSINALIFQSH